MQTGKPRIGALTVLEHFAAAPIDETRRTLALAELVTMGRRSAGNSPAPANGADATQRQHDGNRPAKPGKRGVAQGERHGSAKVDPDKVRRIRREYRGPQSGRRIAAELGITQTTVRSIAYRQTWKHLPAEPGDFKPGNKNEPEKAANGETIDHSNRESNGKQPRTTGLDPDEVHQIRRDYLRIPIPAIAEAHGVSETTVVGIANRISWRSVEPGPHEYVRPPDIEGTRVRRQPRPLPAPGAEETT